MNPTAITKQVLAYCFMSKSDRPIVPVENGKISTALHQSIVIDRGQLVVL
jgi:hypothetical protein